jgi:transketolase N-terminal domain/subunit
MLKALRVVTPVQISLRWNFSPRSIFRILHCSPQLKDSDDRDIYIQSKGHAVGGYYCVLAEAGFIPLEWLATYQRGFSPARPPGETQNPGH